MIDLISRQDVIKMIQETEQMHPYKVPGNRESYGEYAEAWNDATCLIEAQMIFIASMESEQKIGEWVHGEYSSHCSECGYVPLRISPFCPNCGADMSGGE